jgi:hypothetical protein
MEIDLKQGGAAALLIAALSGGGGVVATQSTDRCVELVKARVEDADQQRQADLKAQQTSYQALQAMCVEQFKTLRAMCGK